MKNKYIYYYTNHLGNVRLSYTGNGPGIELIEENNYYPFGLKHQGYNNLGGNPNYNYKYNGKELQETGMYDYGARMYMPDIGRWGVVDPLAETSRRWNPYTYAYNNPIRFIDPDGRQNKDIIITGSEKDKAFQELQKSVAGQLNLSMDSSGKVTYTEVGTVGRDAQQLKNAIDDHSIIVSAVAENTKITSTGQLYIGGAFMGNTVTISATGNTVIAHQEINPTVLGTMSTYFEKPGSDTLHEFTEAYQGAIISKSTGISSGLGGTADSVYSAAHSAATPQSGTVKETIYDASGTKLDLLPGGVYPPTTAKADYSVKKSETPEQIIQTYP